jgi:hypothetical protein
MDNKKTLKVLAVFLIIVETLMIGYSYFTSLSWTGIGVALIYLLLALSDMVSGKNKLLTYFLIFISVTISIPRAILQVSEIVENGRETDRQALLKTPKPIERKMEISLLDCGRIPYWEGAKQIECSKDNQRQIEEKNKLDIYNLEKIETYTNNMKEREMEIKESFMKYITLKSFSQILLILLVTPILPIVVILLIHEDFILTSEYQVEIEEEKEYKPRKRSKGEEDKKQKAKTLLRAGIKVSEIKEELGLSRSTLYRYKKEIET